TEAEHDAAGEAARDCRGSRPCGLDPTCGPTAKKGTAEQSEQQESTIGQPASHVPSRFGQIVRVVPGADDQEQYDEGHADHAGRDVRRPDISGEIAPPDRMDRMPEPPGG